MPIKHQTDSYRIRRGVKFICFRDVLDTAQGDLLTQARADVAHFRSQGWKAFYEKQSDYYRVFVETDHAP